MADFDNEEALQNLMDLADSPVMLAELIDLLQYRYDQIDLVDEPMDIGFDCPLDVHCTYTARQILTAFDDDDKEITRCIIEQWIDNKDDNFYEEVAVVLRSVLSKQKDVIEKMAILKPYSFVLEDDDHEHLAELYLVDDDTAIIDQELMAGLDKDLDNFLEDLLKD